MTEGVENARGPSPGSQCQTYFPELLKSLVIGVPIYAQIFNPFPCNSIVIL